MQFRLSTVLSVLAVLSAFLALFAAYYYRDDPLRLTSESGPSIALDAKVLHHKYEFQERGDTFTLRTTLNKNEPTTIYPAVKWSCEFSNGSTIDWSIDDLAVHWDTQSLSVADHPAAGKPYDFLNGKEGVSTVKFWWVSVSQPQRIVQVVHFFVIENEHRTILAEHQVRVIVELILPSDTSG